MVSCGNTVTNPSQETQTTSEKPATTNSSAKTQTSPPLETNNTQPNASKQPTVGTVKNMVEGDLKCYVTLLDENGTEREVGADFEICPQQKTFLNKKVRLFYETVAVSDCQSAEPCGKTKQESLITKMEIIS